MRTYKLGQVWSWGGSQRVLEGSLETLNLFQWIDFVFRLALCAEKADRVRLSYQGVGSVKMTLAEDLLDRVEVFPEERFHFMGPFIEQVAAQVNLEETMKGNRGPLIESLKSWSGPIEVSGEGVSRVIFASWDQGVDFGEFQLNRRFEELKFKVSIEERVLSEGKRVDATTMTIQDAVSFVNSLTDLVAVYNRYYDEQGFFVVLGSDWGAGTVATIRATRPGYVPWDD